MYLTQSFQYCTLLIMLQKANMEQSLKGADHFHFPSCDDVKKGIGIHESPVSSHEFRAFHICDFLTAYSKSPSNLWHDIDKNSDYCHEGISESSVPRFEASGETESLVGHSKG